MGRYKRNPKVYKLKFDPDDELHGLEVLIRSLPVAEFLRVTALAAAGDNSTEASEKLLHSLADQLVEWNLDNEDGSPVPATFEGLVAQELDFVMRIFRAWMDAMGSVPDPLGQSSPATGISPVPLPPMDVSSLPQAS